MIDRLRFGELMDLIIGNTEKKEKKEEKVQGLSALKDMA